MGWISIAPRSSDVAVDSVAIVTGLLVRMKASRYPCSETPGAFYLKENSVGPQFKFSLMHPISKEWDRY